MQEVNLKRDEIRKAVIEMDDVKTAQLVNTALKQGLAPQDILNKCLIPGMKEVGELFTRKEYYVPEVLLASEAFYAGFNIVKPLIKSQPAEKKTKVIIGVVKGDIHDIGKNIVKVLIEASGYDIMDLGKDVSTERFIKAVAIEKPAVLAMSSLMTTTLVHMEEVIKELIKKKMRRSIKVIVGGAPVNEEFANRIGADGYAEDATQAVKLIKKITIG